MIFFMRSWLNYILNICKESLQNEQQSFIHDLRIEWIMLQKAFLWRFRLQETDNINHVLQWKDF